MLNSQYWELGPVYLPLPFHGRQKYMHTFDLTNPVMAPGFEDYLVPVVKLCGLAGALTGIAHMTVDERLIEAGKSQRRPGPHVDGCFTAGKWGHDPPSWNHYCNNTGTELGRMPVIVAASVAGCKAYRGVFGGHPASDGDLSHLALPDGEILPANVGFLLSPDCVHESLPMSEPTHRTFLRVALPVDFSIKR